MKSPIVAQPAPLPESQDRSIGRIVSVTGAKAIVLLDDGMVSEDKRSRARAERPEMGTLFAIDTTDTVVLAQQLGEADHGVEGCPELMAHVGDEFGFDRAGQLGLDPRRMLGEPSLVPQHRVGEQRRVLRHQGWPLSRPSSSTQHDPNRRLRTPDGATLGARA